MKKLNSIAVLLTIICSAFLSCNDSDNKILSADDRVKILSKGDSIANQAQNILLNNVAKAIATGGTDYAVDFCNVNAMPLTDSASALHNVVIQRLSDKNRNPSNAILSKADSLAWEKIKQLTTQPNDQKHLIEQNKNGDVYYYKPIVLALTTCLACHGNTQTDIAAGTLKIIQEKYPNDKATGYKEKELRGMWKIKM